MNGVVAPMSEAWPNASMLLVAVVWLALFTQSHRLFCKFRAKYPDIARRDIPYALEFYRHPEKFFYFFRRKLLVILSILVPPLGMALLVVVGMFVLKV